MRGKLIILWVVLATLVFGIGIRVGGDTPIQTSCVPAFADGDGPYYLSGSPSRYKIVPAENKGKKLIVKGKLLRSDCKTVVKGAVIDIWQADETGSYQRDWYRGKVTTDNFGNYKFETVIPMGYGEGTAFRPPHIHFKIWENDRLLVTSEIFFPESKGKAGFEDAYIMKLTDSRLSKVFGYVGTHDIVLP
jgi:protocatechuate 3,4-dioxygenase beta subunit